MTYDTARLDRQRDPLDELVAGHGIRWEDERAAISDIIDGCDTQAIGPIVYHRLRDHARHVTWGADLSARLEAAAHAAAASELLRQREIAAVLGTLTADGIRPILTKGVALAYSVYDAPSLRPYADVDSLVRRDSVDAIKRTLARLGYAEALSSAGETLFCQFQLVRRDRHGLEHAFDFHWKISTQAAFAEALTYEELDAAAEPIPLLGPGLRRAGEVHALLLACIHPVMHHRNVSRTIWLYDIHLLASRLSACEFEQFTGLAVEKRVAAICARQLAIAATRFGTRVPDRVFAALASQKASEPSAAYLNPVRRWHHELIDNVRAREGWIDRLRLLREVLLPSPRYLVASHAQLGSFGYVLLPFLYLHRGLHGAWNVLTGRK